MSELIEVTIKIPIPPAGWRYDGVRRVCRGESYFWSVGWEIWWDNPMSQDEYPVAVREQRWRPATAADVGRTDARFSSEKRSWTEAKLIHVAEDGYTPFISWTNPHVGVSVGVWQYCEVPILEGK